MTKAISVSTQDIERGGRQTVLVLIDDLPYWPLTSFFREHNLGIDSEKGYALAVARLMNWFAAKIELDGQIETLVPTAMPKPLTKDLFNAFLHDLLHGTIKGEGDPSSLWWKPASAKSVQLTAQRLSEFSDWLAVEHATTPLNPKDRFASASEQIASLRHFATKKRMSAMAHAKNSAKASKDAGSSRRVKAPGKPSAVAEMVAAFPPDKIDDLLWTGFENEKHKGDPRPWVRWNLRDILVTLICLYGGTRESEPMHLWVDDVFEDPTDPASCKILIHQPDKGLVDYVDPITGKAAQTNRQDYLNRFCGGKKPLTMETGRRHSGWKGCLLTERKRQAFHIFWIDAQAGRLFRQIWSLYIKHSRPVQPNTPWAFLTKDGQPMGTATFIDSFKTAVEKIGLTHSKWNGTTPHGLRHRYGQWLNDLNIPEKHGQICMHHASIASQNTYRQLTPSDVADILSSARSPHVSIQVPTRLLED